MLYISTEYGELTAATLTPLFPLCIFNLYGRIASFSFTTKRQTHFILTTASNAQFP